MTSADDKVRDRFRHFLLAVPTRDLSAGWQLATDLGQPAVPLLWDMLKAERSDVGQRLRLLAAAMFAGGPLEDERLFAWLALQKPMLEERTLAALVLAMGPMRTRAVPNFWTRLLGGQKEPELILAIGARLASVRFPGSAEGAPVIAVNDPGLVAATAFAGLPVPASMEDRWWNLRATERHAELVWRGGMLGAARTLDRSPRGQDSWLERATEVMRLPEGPAASRAVAVWLRACGRDLRPEGSPLDVAMLQVATSDIAGAMRLQPWLGPVPQPRDDAPQRLAVAYALSRRPETVIAERALWLPDSRIARHIAMALAWSIAGEAKPAPVDIHVPDLPEWDFVRRVSGCRADGERASDDPALQALLDLCRQDRISQTALRRSLEEALWRGGSHPRLSAVELEHALIRDLLLAGSNPGNKYQSHLRQDLRYSPGGMDRNDAFFAIAVAAFEFCAEPRSPMPAEHRLSN